MQEKLITVGIGIIGWLGTIVIIHLFQGTGKNKSTVRCSNAVKREIKSIKRYNKSINDSCK